MADTPGDLPLTPGAAVENGEIQANDAPKSIVQKVSLSEYFSEKRISPKSFVKAVKLAKIAEFDEADRSVAIELIQQHDTSGERLWGLITISQLPDALRRWVWSAAETHLSKITGADVSTTRQTPEELIALLKRRFPTPPPAKAKGEDRRFFYGIRIAAAVLAFRYRLQAFESIRICSPLLVKSEARAAEITAKAVRAGSKTEFSLAAALAFFADAMLLERAGELNQARVDINSLERRLDNAISEGHRLTTSLSEASARNDAVTEELRQLRKQMEADRQHAGHDLAGLRARHAVLLRERVSPLIEDAIDALELSKPAPEIAIERMRWALSTIKESLG